MKCYKCKHCRYRGTRYYCSKDRKWISSENYYTMKTIACSEHLKKDDLVGDYVLFKLSQTNDEMHRDLENIKDGITYQFK